MRAISVISYTVAQLGLPACADSPSTIDPWIGAFGSGATPEIDGSA